MKLQCLWIMERYLIFCYSLIDHYFWILQVSVVDSAHFHPCSKRCWSHLWRNSHCTSIESCRSFSHTMRRNLLNISYKFLYFCFIVKRSWCRYFMKWWYWLLPGKWWSVRSVTIVMFKTRYFAHIGTANFLVPIDCCRCTMTVYSWYPPDPLLNKHRKWQVSVHPNCDWTYLPFFWYC